MAVYGVCADNMRNGLVKIGQTSLDRKSLLSGYTRAYGDPKILFWYTTHCPKKAEKLVKKYILVNNITTSASVRTTSEIYQGSLSAIAAFCKRVVDMANGIYMEIDSMYDVERSYGRYYCSNAKCPKSLCSIKAMKAHIRECTVSNASVPGSVPGSVPDSVPGTL